MTWLHGLRCTPLHNAAGKGFSEIVKLLVQAGADVHIRADKVRTVIADIRVLVNVFDGDLDLVSFMVREQWHMFCFIFGIVVVPVAVVVMHMVVYVQVHTYRVKLAWILLESEDTWTLFVAYNWLCRGGGLFI